MWDWWISFVDGIDQMCARLSEWMPYCQLRVELNRQLNWLTCTHEISGIEYLNVHSIQKGLFQWRTQNELDHFYCYFCNRCMHLIQRVDSAVTLAVCQRLHLVLCIYREVSISFKWFFAVKESHSGKFTLRWLDLYTIASANSKLITISKCICRNAWDL